MATSKVKVANLALSKIGAKRISLFSDDSPEARAINAVYDDTRDEVLAEHEWTFALKRFALATVDETVIDLGDDLPYVYSKPTDMISLVHNDTAGVVISVEGDRILSNEENLKIKYVARVDDPNKYPPKFVQALVCKLAYNLCFEITESQAKAEKLLAEYTEFALPKATTADSFQGTVIEAKQDQWENAHNA